MTDSKREIRFSMKAFLAFFLTFMLSLSFLAYQINVLENTNFILSERLTQLEEKQIELQSFLEKNYGVSSLEELEQKIKMRYTGNPFTTELWSGQLQAENITGMHWYTYISGTLYNRTDVIANPKQTATFIIWNDTSTNDVYAKNTTSGQIQYGGSQDAGGVDGANASDVILSAINALANGGTILLKTGTYVLDTPLLYQNNNITIVGEGIDNTVLKAGWSGDSANHYYMVDFNGKNSCILSSLTLDANSGTRWLGGSDETGGGAGQLITSYDIIVMNVKFVNSASNGVQLKVIRGIIANSIFKNTANNHILIQSSENVVLSNLIMRDFGDTAIATGGTSTAKTKNIAISNIIIQQVDSSKKDTGIGIDIETTDGFSISNVIIEDTQYGLQIFNIGSNDGSSNGTISALNIKSVKLGIVIGSDNTATSKTQKISLTNFVVIGDDQVSGKGITLYGVSDIIISDGIVHYNQYGVRFFADTSANNIVKVKLQNLIITNSSVALYFDSSASGTTVGVDIVDCWLYNNTSNYSNDGSATDLKIERNRGFVTENKGSSTFSGTSVSFTHGLAGTPDYVWASFNSTGYGDWTWTANSTHITITVTDSGDYTVYWRAYYEP